jgi:hypothetical protein
MTILTLMLVETGGRVRGAASDEFGRLDTSGLAMTLIAMAVIFIALILLYLTFRYVARLSNVDMKKRFRKNRPDLELDEDLEHIPGETIAAISLALHLYNQQLRGLEDAVMTFKNAAKTYSPWSSKIYGLRRTPKN